LGAFLWMFVLGRMRESLGPVAIIVGMNPAETA
jgi:hypothetical protein